VAVALERIARYRGGSVGAAEPTSISPVTFVNGLERTNNIEDDIYLVAKPTLLLLEILVN
jgi:hypothetical protein